MRRLVMLSLCVAALGCESASSSSGGNKGGDTQAGADATDAADGSDATDSAADGSDAADSATDGSDAADSAADGSDAADSATDGSDAADSATDGSDAADGVDGDGPAPLKAYSGGTCPTMEAGKMTFKSSGMDRELVVTLPAEPNGAGVVFLWHGFGDTDTNFSAAVGAKGMSKGHNVITITPQAAIDPLSSEKLAPYKELAASFIGPLPPTFSVLDSSEPDITLFDDVLSCLNEQYGVDRTRVYTFGFSQGAIFSGRLVMERSDVLAAAALWSGGLGSNGGLIEVVRIPYVSPKRRIPVLAVAGGAPDLWPNEQLPLVNFQTGTDELVAGLLKDGHAVVACSHGLGHTIPSDGLSWGLPFLFDHVYTPDGASNYYGHDGSGFPKYCTMPPAAPQ